MSNTVNNAIPFVPENAIDPAAGLNLSLMTVDALMQLAVVSVGLNAPPGSPANGARYIIGTTPTGAWSARANQVGQWLDGGWRFYQARYALNQGDGKLWVRAAATWAIATGGGVGGSGTVTSVALSAPEGFSVGGSPVTGSGTIDLDFAAGYSLPSDVEQAEWSSAYGWGNHATAGYERRLTAGANVTIDRTDPLNPVISAVASGGSGEWSAETVSQVEAEAGTGTTRRAWTAQRVRQSVEAWWAAISTAFGRSLVGAADAAAGRTKLGLGTAATRAALGTTGALYGRDSILGAVSQLADVPTGAIIERGSNANGEYWRYAGGMQICFVSRTTQVTWTPAGALFSTEGSSPAWILPAASVGGVFSGFSVSNNGHWASSSNFTTIFIQPTFYSTASGVTQNIEFLTHVGRWH